MPIYVALHGKIEHSTNHYSEKFWSIQTSMSSANKNQKSRLWSSDNLYDKTGIKEQNIKIENLWPNANLRPIFKINLWKNPYLGKSKPKAKLQWNLFITTYECYPTLYTAENLNSFGKKIINNLKKKPKKNDLKPCSTDSFPENL